jgi:hypothetical protein
MSKLLWLTLIFALPALAQSVNEFHNKKPESFGVMTRDHVAAQVSVPETGTLPLTVLGLSAMGVYIITRRKDK